MSTRLPRTAECIREKQTLRLVCYGDSISEVGRSPTWFGGADAKEANWGQQLGRMLEEALPGIRVAVDHFAIGGQNAYEGLGRLDGLAGFDADLVMVEFGTNDCGFHFLQPDETALALDHLVDGIRTRYAADVVLVGTAGDNPEIDRFRHVQETIAATRAVAERKEVPFVDMRAAILAATGDGARWAAFHLGRDNCHPDNAGHRVWAEAAARVILHEIGCA